MVKFNKFLDGDIFMKKASGPSDIIWENRELSDNTRLFRGIIAFLIISFMLVVSGVIIYKLNYASSDLKGKYPNIHCFDHHGFFASMYSSNLNDIFEAGEKEFISNY